MREEREERGAGEMREGRGLGRYDMRDLGDRVKRDEGATVRMGEGGIREEKGG